MADIIECGGKPVLLCNTKEEFEITRCRASNDCDTYIKSAYELTETEVQLIIGNLLKQQNQYKTMEQLKNEVINSLKKAKKEKAYLTTKQIVKIVNETFKPWEGPDLIPCENTNVTNTSVIS